MNGQSRQRTLKRMAKDKLTDLKCRDCFHCVLSGWWDPQKICEVSGFPIDENDGACISVLPKNIIKNGTKSN